MIKRNSVTWAWNNYNKEKAQILLTPFLFAYHTFNNLQQRSHNPFYPL